MRFAVCGWSGTAVSACGRCFDDGDLGFEALVSGVALRAPSQSVSALAGQAYDTGGVDETERLASPAGTRVDHWPVAGQVDELLTADRSVGQFNAGQAHGSPQGLPL